VVAVAVRVCPVRAERGGTGMSATTDDIVRILEACQDASYVSITSPFVNRNFTTGDEHWVVVIHRNYPPPAYKPVTS
jgi:hypothetical protein